MVACLDCSGPTALYTWMMWLYLDKTFEEHLRNLKEVFQPFAWGKLDWDSNQAGAIFALSYEVEFLGNIVSAKGICTDPKKTEKVAKWPVPTSKKEVQQFLGLANYYRRFVKIISPALPNLCTASLRGQPSLSGPASVSLPLTDPSSSGKGLWQHQSWPFLTSPNHSYWIQMPVTPELGPVLSQSMEDGCEHVIAYASHQCWPNQRCHYCVTRRELLAYHKLLLSSISDHTYWEENFCFIQTMVLWHGLWNFKQTHWGSAGPLARKASRVQHSRSAIDPSSRKHQNADALSEGHVSPVWERKAQQWG